jgi:hypothetical protein
MRRRPGRQDGPGDYAGEVGLLLGLGRHQMVFVRVTPGVSPNRIAWRLGVRAPVARGRRKPANFEQLPLAARTRVHIARHRRATGSCGGSWIGMLEPPERIAGTGHAGSGAAAPSQGAARDFP